MAGERHWRESNLAYAYFELYRDMPPHERNLRALTKITVRGKTRCLQQVGRWSKLYGWQARIKEWDAEGHAHKLKVAREQRNADIEKFISADFIISDSIQKMFTRILTELARDGKTSINTLQLRQATMAYKEGRSNLAELIGVLDPDADRTLGSQKDDKQPN